MSKKVSEFHRSMAALRLREAASQTRLMVARGGRLQPNVRYAAYDEIRDLIAQARRHRLAA